ncbi:MAG TPA: hypothetical protein VIN61_11980 [Gammaproteobacteria bacterium]
MKLRVRGNSIRLRLTKSEVERLATAGVAEDAVRFAPQAELRYRVEVVPDGPLAARYADSSVTVLVPRQALERWLDPQEVSMRGEQALGGGEMLKILVEKDFACLVPRPDEPVEDLFENPRAERC